MHPILFKIGPLTIYSYGFFVAMGFLLSSLLLTRDSKNFGLQKNEAWDLLICILLSGIVGARLFHVLLNSAYYFSNPLEIIMLQKGGLAIQGALLTSIAMGIVFISIKRLSFWKAGDLIMIYLPLGQAIGRIGCYFNGCCYGDGAIPIQLLSAGVLFGIFLVLKFIRAIKVLSDGDLFLIYFMLYSPARFVIDMFRADLDPVIAGLTASQLFSASLFIAALLIFILRKKR